MFRAEAQSFRRAICSARQALGLSWEDEVVANRLRRGDEPLRVLCSLCVSARNHQNEKEGEPDLTPFLGNSASGVG
jgi:hypothetical protein